MFFRPRLEKAVIIRASWYRLTEKWWPDCFWVMFAQEAKRKGLTMKQPDKMAALAAELEGTYGKVILSDWPWVKQMQERNDGDS